ncbi:hyaluronidase-like [Ischnura elegans]|uniref:hyaluronidase-like n=1 Tax=Ischnura elegans TaxID=197161 RepID=UPI001ED8AE5A|nr:hyaluronidase-like [Ischnura elegans]
MPNAGGIASVAALIAISLWQVEGGSSPRFGPLSIFGPLYPDSGKTIPDIESMDVPGKAFTVYWNVPTFMCRKYGVLFDLKEFDIQQNENDDFRGSTSVIMYDPGEFPAIVDDSGNDPGPSKRAVNIRNGGVPQQGNLTLHLKSFRAELEKMIPDPTFSGVAVIDFEFWRPSWKENWGTLLKYRELSRKLVQSKHPSWNKNQVESEAKQKFEYSARKFMEETLKLAKRLRPNGRWGYYAFPYCYNFTPGNPGPECSTTAIDGNSRIRWLYDGSTALFPSVYLESKKLTEEENYEFIYSRVNEAKRVTRGSSTPVYPYVRYNYRDAPIFLSKVDIFNSMVVPRLLKADGVMIWGSGKDVNSAEKCQRLLTYATNTLGPVAKFVSDLPEGKVSNADLENRGRSGALPSVSGATRMRKLRKAFLSVNTLPLNEWTENDE